MVLVNRNEFKEELMSYEFNDSRSLAEIISILENLPSKGKKLDSINTDEFEAELQQRKSDIDITAIATTFHLIKKLTKPMSTQDTNNIIERPILIFPDCQLLAVINIANNTVSYAICNNTHPEKEHFDDYNLAYEALCNHSHRD